ncbi:hypothetical protein [Dankookia sp. P2]|uniref:hypothetical protein n=1 Tax=Dankookia sp. P2 TaxID=3423955 RepID=UPI003D67F82F
MGGAGGTRPPSPKRGRPRREAAPAAPGLARAAWEDRLWGPGFTLPGGEAEALRLAQLLPLSPATTLLLFGQDAGGAAQAIARQSRAWLAVHQHDPALAARMAPLLRPLGKRAALQGWDPAAPAFRAGFHHHALALEPLRAGAAPAALAGAVAAALKPNGQLVLVETVAAGAPPGPRFGRWLALEDRAAPPPGQAAVEAALLAAGFTLHVTESLGGRQDAAATEAWARLLAGLRGAARPAAGAAAAALVTEAEAWLLRHRLLESGAIAVLRWHASLRS